MYPHVQRDLGAIEVTLCDSRGFERTLDLEVVLDLDSSGYVIGLEIINLKFHAGPSCLEWIKRQIPNTGDGLRYGFDGKSDAFYLQLSRTTSSNQEAVIGTLILDRESRIVALRARTSSSITE